jgi:CheY-like chemotaxis protein
MACILAIEADPKRRTLLARLVREHVKAKLVLADSAADAISLIGHRMPDVILAPALMSPSDGAELMEHVKQLHGAPYVQLLTTPAFDMLAEPEVLPKRGFSMFRRQAPVTPQYDSAMVGALIADALVRARQARAEYAAWLTHQAEIEEMADARRSEQQAGALALRSDTSDSAASDDRRTAPRKALGEIPWLSTVRLAWSVDISLINISSSGVLIESGSKFEPGSTADLHLTGPDTNLVVPVRFVRSEIAKVDSRGVKYQAAAAFGKEIDLSAPRSLFDVASNSAEALALLLATVLSESGRGAEPAHARFARGVRELVGARDVQVRMGGAVSSAGRETLYFNVPGDDRTRTVLQVVFDRGHNVTPSQFQLLKAAAWLTAAALELGSSAASTDDRTQPPGLLTAQVA